MFNKKMFHGTNSSDTFNSLEINDDGLLWFTEEIFVAEKYARTYYRKGIPKIFHALIRGNILDLTDFSHEAIQNNLDSLWHGSIIKPQSDNWHVFCGFDLLEHHPWFIEHLKALGFDGAVCRDLNGGYHHSSVAVWNTRAIEITEVIPLDQT